MAKGLIILNDNTMKVVEPQQAVDAYNALTGIVEPTEEQADFLIHIKRIFIPPSHRPAHYEAIDSPFKGDRKAMDVRHLEDPKAPGPDHLTHPGRLQGMSQAIPLGDQ